MASGVLSLPTWSQPSLQQDCQWQLAYLLCQSQCATGTVPQKGFERSPCRVSGTPSRFSWQLVLLRNASPALSFIWKHLQLSLLWLTMNIELFSCCMFSLTCDNKICSFRKMCFDTNSERAEQLGHRAEKQAHLGSDCSQSWGKKK